MSTENIDVSDIAPAELLAALYNRSHVQGMGVLQAQDGDMTVEQAEKLLTGENVESDYPNISERKKGKSTYFDYLYGKVMKVEINGESLNPNLYDRDLGQGAAQKVVDSFKTDGGP